MGWWIDELQMKFEAGLERTAGDVATALIFDEAEVTPALAAPVEVLQMDDVLTASDVDSLLRAVLGDDGFTPHECEAKASTARRSAPRGRPLVSLPHFYDTSYTIDPRHFDRGVPLFVAVDQTRNLQQKRVWPGVAQRFTVMTDGIVRAFVKILYGVGDFRVPHGVRNLDQLVMASNSGSYEGFVETLDALTAPARAEIAEAHAKLAEIEVAEKADMDAAAAKDAKRRGGFSRDVPKLSEMQGFGDARAWGLNLARDLRDYASGEIGWDDVDRGVLLSGPPGCGKTTFARALSREVDAHFESITYADFEVGGGSYVVKAMKKKFDEWRKIAGEGRPVLVFWDEIDSMGSRGHNAHNDSYWSAIINALLDFLDGAEPRDGIVMVGATNHVERVDPAIRRAGRLDRHVEMPAPTIAGIADVIAHHLKVDASHPDTRAAAKMLRGASPADVALACREARRMGRMLSREADAFDLADLITWSRPKLHPRQERLVRIHEAGHAVAALSLEGEHGWRLEHVDTQPGRRGEFEFAGAVLSSKPPWTASKSDALREIAQTLAGRAAEARYLGEVSIGGETDLRQATAAAERLVRRTGLGDTLMHVALQSPCTPEEVAQIEAILQERMEMALEMVTDWRVPTLARLLEAEPFMTGDEVRAGLKKFMDDVFFAERDEDLEEWPMAA